MSASDLGLDGWVIREPGRPAIYRIAAGGLVNALGSDATAVAFGFYLYDRTGSAIWLSVWFFTSFGINGLFTPVAGWLADRFDRRRIIIASDLAAAACSLALIAANGPVALVAIAFDRRSSGVRGGRRSVRRYRTSSGRSSWSGRTARSPSRSTSVDSSARSWAERSTSRRDGRPCSRSTPRPTWWGH